MNTEKTDEIQSYLDWTHKGYSAWWLYIIGTILTFFMMQPLKDVLGIPLLILLAPLFGDSNLGDFIATHLSFIFLWIFPPLFVWLAHKRPAWSVALPERKFEGWNMAMGFLFAGLTLLGTYGIFALFGGVKLSFAPRTAQEYFPFLIAAIFVFLIQTSAEELAFRGYIMQAVRRFTASPVIIVALVGVLFSLPHLPNLVGQKLAWYGILVYVIEGGLLAWLAYRTGSLWVPIGWHFGNNLLITTLIDVANSGDVVQGLPLIVADKLPGTIFYIVARAISVLIFISILTWLYSRREKAILA